MVDKLSMSILRLLELIQKHPSEALEVVSRAYQVAFEGASEA